MGASSRIIGTPPTARITVAVGSPGGPAGASRRRRSLDGRRCRFFRGAWWFGPRSATIASSERAFASPRLPLRLVAMKTLLVLVSVCLANLLHAATALGAEEGSFASEWKGSRVWVGPEHWANPLQDWRVDSGELIGKAGRGRSVHRLTHQVGAGRGTLETSVTLRLVGAAERREAASRHWAGFSLGIRGDLDSYRHALVHPKRSVDAGVRGDGTVFFRGQTSDRRVPLEEPVRLSLRVTEGGDVTVRAEPDDGSAAVLLSGAVEPDDLKGNIALAVQEKGQPTEARWGFRDWQAAGTRLQSHPEQTFGPVLWTQYTLHAQTLKLTAHFPPIGEQDDWQARLQLRGADGSWATVADQRIDPLSRTAAFRVDGWNGTRNARYRVAYSWQGEDHYWEGTIRADPRSTDQLEVGVFSCDHGELFPNARIVGNVKIQDPDLVFFAGDQIYESYGGFGVARGAGTEQAMLDYLRKYWQFGWSWREVLRDRPSIIIPDDHDVFQGNLWGHGGRALPAGDSRRPAFAKGGFLMPVRWVNAIQRTQVSHLPDPVDPEPCESGIEVYFTELRYGGASFAIIEDRKFKAGPNSEVGGKGSANEHPGQYDLGEIGLLGRRQEAFLQRWAEQAADLDVRFVCSQTIFAKASTHSGQDLARRRGGTDSGGWPKPARDRALRLLRPASPIMLHGDQHFGSLLIHGVDDWEDAPLAFMVPGTSNGFPRAWWPEQPGENRPERGAEWTGRFFDDLGNRITVLAAGNPERGSNVQRPEPGRNIEDIQHNKGSGHGVVIVDRDEQEVTFQLWRLQFDAAHPEPEDQFTGFPQTLPLPQPGRGF